MEKFIEGFRLIKIIRRGHKRKSEYNRLLSNPLMFNVYNKGGSAIINSKTGEIYGVIE